MAGLNNVPLEQQWAYQELVRSAFEPGEVVTPLPGGLYRSVDVHRPNGNIDTVYEGQSLDLPSDALGMEKGKAVDLGDKDSTLSSSALWKVKGAAAAIKGFGQAYMASQGLKTQASLLESQAGMAEANAKIMDLGVDIAYRRRDAEIGNLTLRAGQIKAQQRVAFASRGIAIGVGSTAEVAASTQLQKEVDVLTAEMNGLMSAWNYKRQAAMYRAQAAGARNAARIYRHSAPVVGGLYAGAAALSLASAFRGA